MSGYIIPRAGESLPDTDGLRRSLRMEGELGGLRYELGVRISELNSSPEHPENQALLPAPASRVLLNAGPEEKRAA